ncbi:uncharacterized protein LOC132751961 [Ruditapes philippinarum]|uniref:uncharacterized protein LOC132751961 n=1 Tax=Ruditapes philippinarum TaxID=129788 RepID=UPI00295BBE6B|nr:uncharacterized protein LOC132751961 [Ruditapes philippinarum]
MDCDEKKYAGSLSGSDGVHETSFNTASEGAGSDPSDRSLMHDYREDEEPVRSSRSMPVPEHLQKRPPTDIEAPPPSYDEAIAPPTATARQAEGEEDSLTPDEIAVIMRSREDVNTAGVHDTSAANAEDDLSPDQQDMYNQRQRDRNNYLPSAERRQSFEEAMEMDSGSVVKVKV